MGEYPAAPLAEDNAEQGAEDFFRQQRAAFAHTLATQGSEATLLQAWDSFDGNVAIQCEGQPPVHCAKGCASCCTLRVTALAPEVFVLADYLRATAPALQRHGIDLIAAVREADAATRGLDEGARVAARRRCAFVVQGVCLIHRARPLSCRGHASHDRRACADAAAGRVDQVPYSGPHRVVRLLLQAALQAALRDDGKAWGAYELHHALVLALDRPDAQAAWAQGEDPLAEAAADVEQREAMAAGFDEIRG
jgi:Fe-S-cluster containining protein